jgi:hypothetical protein
MVLGDLLRSATKKRFLMFFNVFWHFLGFVVVPNCELVPVQVPYHILIDVCV